MWQVYKHPLALLHRVCNSDSRHRLGGFQGVERSWAKAAAATSKVQGSQVQDIVLQNSLMPGNGASD